MSTTIDIEPKKNGELTTQPAPQRRIVEDHGPMAYLMDTARFEHTYRIASVMAAASILPDHLRDKQNNNDRTVANCFLVVNQAFRWGMDPFSVAPETYVVGGKLAFQGKLVAAVVNARAGLDGRLEYSFTGSRDDRSVVVSGTFRGESEPKTITVRLGDVKTRNEMWTKDPDQKLVYTGAIKWARRWCPEIVLGVLTDDDAEVMAECPKQAISGRKIGTSDLTGRILGVQETPQPPQDNADGWQCFYSVVEGELRQAVEQGSLAAINAVQNRCTGPESTLDEEQRQAIAAACEVSRNAIKATRGERSNQMFQE